MTIQRNLASWVNGDPGREAVRRTINDMEQRLSQLQQLFSAIQARPPVGELGLTEAQKADVAGLIGALGQSVIGVNTPDPILQNLPTGNGTVTSFSAGDLSPLFVTTESNPTTTPTLNFAQIVQNANLIFAGPSSGVAAVPTFRLPVAADTYLITDTLLATPTLNLNTSIKQNLYTVPGGKSGIITRVVLRSPSTDLSAGSTTRLGFGFDAGATDWTSATQFLQVTSFTTANLFAIFSQEFAAASGVSPIGTAGQSFGAITDTAFGSAATLEVGVLGYLF